MHNPVTTRKFTRLSFMVEALLVFRDEHSSNWNKEMWEMFNGLLEDLR